MLAATRRSGLNGVDVIDARAMVVPIHSEFSNFNMALLMAHGLITAGAARTILIAVGGNWTRYVDYHTPQAISAADGAAAAVVQRSDDITKFRFVDQHVIVDTSYYGAMYMQADAYTMEPPYRGRFELTLYPTTARTGARAERIAALADRVASLVGTSDADAAARIQAHEIDVLIDTTAHMTGCRLGIFAHRAAPVQCHYIGYHGTTGLTEMDWFIAD